MVDPQAVHQAVADQLKDFLVSGLEHRRALHAQAGQFVDIEEAPPIDVIACGAPAGETIVLMFQQVVQALKAFGVTGVVAFKAGQERRVAVRAAGQFGA